MVIEQHFNIILEGHFLTGLTRTHNFEMNDFLTVQQFLFKIKTLNKEIPAC